MISPAVYVITYLAKNVDAFDRLKAAEGSLTARVVNKTDLSF